MPQSMLALMAMMILSLFSYQQQRNILHTQLMMMRGETATQATGVAIDVLEEIGTMAYDEATKDATITSAGDLTSRQAFNSDAPDDDIDDFDGASFKRYRLTQDDTLRYAVSSSIAYALEDNPDTEVSSPNTQTKYKKVTVKVYNLDLADPDTVTLSQSFSCGSKCDW